MIEKVIASILEAEKKAEEIIINGNSEYKKIIFEAESISEKTKKEVIDGLRIFQKTELEKAEKQAGIEYEKTLAEGRNESETLKEKSKTKKDSAVELIVGKVI